MTQNQLKTQETTSAISYDKAAKMVKDYCDAYPQQAVSHFISREEIEKLLSQPNCAGITIYPGMVNGEMKAIATGATANHTPILEYAVVGNDGNLKEQNGAIVAHDTDGWWNA